MRCLALLFALCSSLIAAEKPNVLLIMADDLRDFGGAFTKDGCLIFARNPGYDRNDINDQESNATALKMP